VDKTLNLAFYLWQCEIHGEPRWIWACPLQSARSVSSGLVSNAV